MTDIDNQEVLQGNISDADIAENYVIAPRVINLVPHDTKPPTGESVS